MRSCLGRGSSVLPISCLEIFWIGVALGSVRAIVILPVEYHEVAPLLLLVCVVAIGAAIGAAFERMVIGVVVTLLIAVVFGLLMPAVMVA